jgi:hypothetical protein
MLAAAQIEIFLQTPYILCHRAGSLCPIAQGRAQFFYILFSNIAVDWFDMRIKKMPGLTGPRQS